MQIGLKNRLKNFPGARLLAASFVTASFMVSAQVPLPPKLEPLAEPPPMATGSGSPDEPRIRIPVQQGDRVEEMRDAGGTVMMLKVTPPGGIPYYLVDTSGNGTWIRRNPLDDGVRVPMWSIKTFD